MSTLRQVMGTLRSDTSAEIGRVIAQSIQRWWPVLPAETADTEQQEGQTVADSNGRLSEMISILYWSTR